MSVLAVQSVSSVTPLQLNGISVMGRRAVDIKVPVKRSQGDTRVC